MTNRLDGTLYAGVATNLARRVWEHHKGVIEGFTKRYGLKILVCTEPHEAVVSAIQREKAIKN